MRPWVSAQLFRLFKRQHYPRYVLLCLTEGLSLAGMPDEPLPSFPCQARWLPVSAVILQSIVDLMSESYSGTIRIDKIDHPGM